MIATEIVWLPPSGALCIGYLLGSIPFGLLLTRFAGLGDVRAIGSGNIGATNVLRTGNKGLAAATLILDAAKGWAAVALVEAVWPGMGLLGAIGAILGHLYPVWLGFKGGKGVATLLGVLIGLHWPCALVYAIVWLGLLAMLRISSLAGMSAAISAPVSAAAFDRFDMVLAAIAFALLVLWKHRANIERLLSGTEPRIGARGG